VSPSAAITPDQFTAFGALLRYLRERAGLSQTELSVAVGYSPAQISRLEHGQRTPDAAVLAARFVPALALDREPGWAARLLALAAVGHAEAATPAPSPPQAAPPPHNLPAALTAFVGRERELTELHGLLTDPAIRLVTLTGPGGIGKTRLALQAASEQLGERLGGFRNGIWFVPLAPVPAPDLVVFAVANTLGLRSSGDETPRHQLLRYLQERAALLVLDNFEHVLLAVELVTEILQQSPQAKILTTSRERLGLRGEWVLEVAGLDVPTADADAAQLPSAVRLFLTSARQASASFSLDGANRTAANRICRLVEGMPLALELAAAWLPVLTADEIAQELQRGLEILTVPAGATGQRQPGLRAVFDRSWGLMTDRERAVFRRLTVFRGGFTREAANAIAGADLNDLASLSSKALIRRSGTRYDLHELLRQYGLEQLEAAGEAQALREQHLAYFVRLGIEAEAASAGPGEVAADRRAREELDNIRGALAHALEYDVASGLQLAGALGFFWPRRNLKEGIDWLGRLLNQPAQAGADRARAKALLALAELEWQVIGEFDRALTYASSALELYRTLGDEHGMASALCSVGWIHGHPGTALAQVSESLACFRRLNDPVGQAWVLLRLGEMRSNSDVSEARENLWASLALCRQLNWVSGSCIRLAALGRLATLHGEFDQAQAHFAEALALGRGDGALYDLHDAINGQAVLHLWQGQYDQAEANFEACIAQNQAVGSLWLSFWDQAHLGRVKLGKGQHGGAHALFAASLRAFHKVHVNTGICYVCEGLAGLALARGEPARAVRLIAWADHTRATDDDVRPPVEQLEVDGVLEAARVALDDAAFAAAWKQGAAMTVDNVVAYALEGDV
jgi:predicted ATPase